MKNKRVVSIICSILGLLLITGGIVLSFNGEKDSTKGGQQSNKNDNSNVIAVDGEKYSYKIDAPYYGKITVGTETFDMLTTDEELDKLDLDGCLFYIDCYEVEDTDDKFDYEMNNWENSYEVNFETYDDTYLQNGCDNCDTNLSTYIKLPKGVTYKSSIDDVIKAYGSPKKQEEYSDNTYMYNDTIDGEKFGYFSSTRLLYKYKKDNVTFSLELFFDVEDNILYKVRYTIEVSKK